MEQTKVIGKTEATITGDGPDGQAVALRGNDPSGLGADVVSEGTGLIPHMRTLDDLFRFCQFLAQADCAPKDYKGKAANILIAIQHGVELGLSPMQALASVKVIGGIASVDSRTALAIVKGRDLVEDCEEYFEIDGVRAPDWFDLMKEVGAGKAVAAVCRITRKGAKRERVSVFTVADAKAAGLWLNGDNWKKWPKRMLKARALGFAVNDEFGDVMKGLRTSEEAQDIVDAQVVATSETIAGKSQPETKGAAVLARISPETVKEMEGEGRTPGREVGNAEALARDLEDQAEQIPAELDAEELAKMLEEIETATTFLVGSKRGRKAYNDVLAAMGVMSPEFVPPERTRELRDQLSRAVDQVNA